MGVVWGEAPNWCFGSGYAHGYGYGYGYGSGYGYGYGYGDGDGSGDGSGDGYGYGYGDGSGDGSGYGYGYGDGSGSGYGYGSGSGSGDGSYQLADLPESGGILALWKSTRDGLPSNGGRSIEPAAPGVVHRVEGAVEACSHGLHATLDRRAWKGDRVWLVELTGEVKWHGDKYVASERRIIREVA